MLTDIFDGSNTTPNMTCVYISVAAYVIANGQKKADYCCACCLRLEARTAGAAGLHENH
jgi:hypothetical protein